MPPKAHFAALADLDLKRLEEFRQQIRRRYTDAQILDELRACAERLGRSPTMREFGADPQSGVHAQTVVDHFGTWNAAKRAAGLVPRRHMSRSELLDMLRALGEELGRAPTPRDIDLRRDRMPSKSLYWQTFGSFTAALTEAGFAVEGGEERFERAMGQGLQLAEELGRLPRFADWAEARKETTGMLTEWQVYRMFDKQRGAWATFQFLLRERLMERGVGVGPDGTLSP